MNTSTTSLSSFSAEGGLIGPGPRFLDFTRLLATASAAAVHALREVTVTWRRHRRREALRDTLRALDDRTLADIGLHRSDIAAVAWAIGDRP